MHVAFRRILRTKTGNTIYTRYRISAEKPIIMRSEKPCDFWPCRRLCFFISNCLLAVCCFAVNTCIYIPGTYKFRGHRRRNMTHRDLITRSFYAQTDREGGREGGRDAASILGMHQTKTNMRRRKADEETKKKRIKSKSKKKSRRKGRIYFLTRRKLKNFILV